MTCTILKDLHNPQDYTFKIRLLNPTIVSTPHNKITLVDQENHQATPRNLRKIKQERRLSLANQTSFTKFQKQSKKL